MKIFKYFLFTIFLRKLPILISTTVLIFLSHFATFTAARSIFSTIEGKHQLAYLDKKGTYIANMDPKSSFDSDFITLDKLNAVYTFLNNYHYAFHVDGFVADIPNNNGMEVTLTYYNKNYSNMVHFPISEGNLPSFDTTFNQEIPVTIGKGLSENYPLGSTLTINDPSLDTSSTFKVKGILEKDVSHPNFYAPHSHEYYNFSLLVPITDEYLTKASEDLKLNGLMDLIIYDCDTQKINELENFLYEELHIHFHFYSHEENIHDFNENYISTLKIVAIIAGSLTVLILFLGVWNIIMEVRTAIKDITINMLIGLSPSRLRTIFYTFHFLLFGCILFIFFIATAYSRHELWTEKNAAFATYGTFGLISADWFSLLTVAIIHIPIIIAIVETALWRTRKMPISLGVLQ
ncbi:MAG: ABC transporter permease [Actinomycetaceae bacterium]|nr:ABC transporter permease [Actinomycetaceae bacterium]